MNVQSAIDGNFCRRTLWGVGNTGEHAGGPGRESAKRLPGRSPQRAKPRILALTADNTRQASDMALRCGMDGVVLKPLMHKTLLEEIAKWSKPSTAGKKEKSASAPPSL